MYKYIYIYIYTLVPFSSAHTIKKKGIRSTAAKKFNIIFMISESKLTSKGLLKKREMFRKPKKKVCNQ